MEKKQILGYGLLGLWIIGLFGFKIYPLNYVWGYIISGFIMVMIIQFLEDKWKKNIQKNKSM